MGRRFAAGGSADATIILTVAIFESSPLLSVTRKTPYVYVPGASLNVLSPKDILHEAAERGAEILLENGTGSCWDKLLFQSHFPVADTPFAEVHPSGS